MLSIKSLIFSYPSVLMFDWVVKKKRQIETDLLCTYDICVG